MADISVIVRLKAVDEAVISTVNNASTAFTGLTIGTTALSVAFKGLQKATDSSFGNFVLGVQNAEKLTGAFAPSLYRCSYIRCFQPLVCLFNCLVNCH